MKYFKTIIFGGALVLFAGAAPALLGIKTNVAHAADCTIKASDLAQIATIQNDPTLSYSDEIKAELAVRQQLVGETIACAKLDVQSLQATLIAASVDSGSQAIQAQFSGKLDDAKNFYNNELVKLNDSGISGTQTIAKEVLQERQSVFAPLSDQINNFILWSQNQALFTTAQTRMDQTSRAVAFIENATPNQDLQTAFDAAFASLATAQSENASAKSAFAQELPASQSLTLIKQSLDSLSVTYQNFSTVGTLIKSLLPQ